jgi:voltage-gated potassium channel
MAKARSESHAKLLDVLKRLDQIRPAAIPIETLRRMQAEIHTDYAELAVQGLAYEEAAQEAIEKADPAILKRVTTRVARLRKEMESLDELDRKLEDSVQRRIIRENMAARLGSRHVLLVLEVTVMALIVVVLALLIYDTGAGPDSERPAWLSSDSIFIIDAVCCLIFMSEFFLRLSCAESKKFVWRHYWIDFVTSIPIPGEAQLARFGRVARLARFARVLRLLRFLRFLRLFFLLWRGMDKLQDVIDVKLMKKTLRWAILVTLLGGLLVYQIEGISAPPTPDSTAAVEAPPAAAEEKNAVSSYPLALWWSFTTVVTGGFGDIHNPKTTGGQVLTAILIVTGMVLVGVFTATLTSLFIGEQAEEIEKLQEELSQRLDRLTQKIEWSGGPDGLDPPEET